MAAIPPPKMTSISILGCGWLGLPLGRHLQQRAYRLRGSTTRESKLPALAAAGIQPYLIRLEPEGIVGSLADFLESDILILNLPPGRRDPLVEEHFPRKVAHLLDRLPGSKLQQLIFVSSTSVYGEARGRVSEESPLLARVGSGKALIEVERQLRQRGLPATILRPAGLAGPGRQPGRFLAGRQHLPHGDAPVNLVHLTDVINLITAIIARQCWQQTFNLCAGQHPTRRAFYTRAARKLQLPPPTFAAGGADRKYICSQQVRQQLDYRFLYDDPFEML
ncbi:MAG: SDR family oxidoreductase [Bacteroidetes bacterium]|nr:MAG: SDR family oxidoreductase [Bacteroidota bacterium]